MKKGFTLAEVLITLAIIGVVAALTIPSVIINAREQGNITAFKKAVSVLNSAISLSIAVDSQGPGTADTAANGASSIINQLMSKMNVVSSSISSTTYTAPVSGTAYTAGTYITTADGMQFIPLPGIPSGTNGTALSYAASRNICYSGSGNTMVTYSESTSAACTSAHSGATFLSAGGAITTARTGNCNAAAPCFMVVDVNGTAAPNQLSSDLNSSGGTITDRFVVAITEDGAAPAGELAKHVMQK